MKDEMIKVELTEDKLNISIGVDYLVHICGEVRIKPDPKKIDLSFIVGSGLDVEFSASSDFSFPVIGTLQAVRGSGMYQCDTHQYKHCRPRMNHWMSPLNCKDIAIHQALENAGFEVEVDTENSATFVKAFKITGIKDGYTV